MDQLTKSLWDLRHKAHKRRTGYSNEEKKVAHAEFHELCKCYPSHKALGDVLGVSRYQIDKWDGRKHDIPLSHLLEAGNLFIWKKGLFSLEKCKEVYERFRPLLSRKIKSDIDRYDRDLYLELKEMEQKGVPVEKTFLSTILLPKEPVEDFVLTYTQLQKALQLPLLVTPDHELLVSPTILHALNDTPSTTVNVRIIALDECIKAQHAFPGWEDYCVFTRCRVIEMAKLYAKKKNLFKQHPKKCLLKDKQKTRLDEKIAIVAGFSGRNAHYLCKRVCKHGIEDVVNAMEEKKILLTIAAKIAALPRRDQAHALDRYLADPRKGRECY